MRTRFEKQLKQLNDELIEMGNMIERAIQMAVSALLTQDADIFFGNNSVFIGSNNLMIVTMPPPSNICDERTVMDFFNAKELNYRHVQRLLIIDKKHIEREKYIYTRLW